MFKSDSTALLRIFKMLHFIVSAALFAITWFIFLNQFNITIAGRYSLFVCAVFPVCLLFFTRVYNAYMVEYLSPKDVSLCLNLSQLISIVLTVGVILIAWSKSYYYPWIFIILFAADIVWDRLWAALAVGLYFRLNKPLRTAVIYRKKTDLFRIKEMERYERKFCIEKYIEDPESFEEITEALDGIEAVFVVGVEAGLRNSIAKYCAGKEIQGYFLPHTGDIIMAGASHIQAFSVPIMAINRTKNHSEYMLIKRLADVLISLAALIILSPLMLITAAAIRLYDGGPALYRQVRLTENGRKFKILKFRSMRVDAEGDGIARLSTGEHDDRITAVGRVIRKIRFDELPQFYNILKGDMTLVGPRPERPEIASKYEEAFPEFRLRLQVRAGLTGYAQVYGRYNTDPCDKLEMDLMYINNMNILEDIKLLFATVRILFLKESTNGIEEGEETALITE